MELVVDKDQIQPIFASGVGEISFHIMPPHEEFTQARDSHVSLKFLDHVEALRPSYLSHLLSLWIGLNITG